MHDTLSFRFTSFRFFSGTLVLLLSAFSLMSGLFSLWFFCILFRRLSASILLIYYYELFKFFTCSIYVHKPRMYSSFSLGSHTVIRKHQAFMYCDHKGEGLWRACGVNDDSNFSIRNTVSKNIPESRRYASTIKQCLTDGPPQTPWDTSSAWHTGRGSSEHTRCEPTDPERSGA